MQTEGLTLIYKFLSTHHLKYTEKLAKHVSEKLSIVRKTEICCV